jgi:hypothetical protein
MGIGPQTKIMRKAKMSFQSGQVKQVIRTYAVEIQTSDKKELEAEVVTMKLRKAMGANCKSPSACQFWQPVNWYVLQTTDKTRVIEEIVDPSSLSKLTTDYWESRERPEISSVHVSENCIVRSYWSWCWR